LSQALARVPDSGPLRRITVQENLSGLTPDASYDKSGSGPPTAAAASLPPMGRPAPWSGLAMDATQLRDLMPQALRLASEAGDAILAVARTAYETREKDDGSPVTRADLASHQLIAAGLGELEPRFPVLSEESTSGDGVSSVPADAAVYWCVDPLDGTKEFINGNGEYTVNIALVDSGDPILGVVGSPAQGTLWYAGRGLGAWRLNCRNGGVDLGQATRLPETSRQGAPIAALVSRSHPSAQTEAFLRDHGIAEVVRRGSSLKICAVAEGVADVYPRFGPTWYWDTAAGAVVAREAGCEVISVETWRPLSYHLGTNLKHAGFLVTSPRFPSDRPAG